MNVGTRLKAGVGLLVVAAAVGTVSPPMGHYSAPNTPSTPVPAVLGAGNPGQIQYDIETIGHLSEEIQRVQMEHARAVQELDSATEMIPTPPG